MIIRLLQLPKFPQGLLHYCGNKAFSDYAFAQAVLKAEAERNPAFKMPQLVQASAAEMGKGGAPLYSVLNCEKARALGFVQGDWQKSVPSVLAALAEI